MKNQKLELDEASVLVIEVLFIAIARVVRHQGIRGQLSKLELGIPTSSAITDNSTDPPTNKTVSSFDIFGAVVSGVGSNMGAIEASLKVETVHNRSVNGWIKFRSGSYAVEASYDGTDGLVVTLRDLKQ